MKSYSITDIGSVRNINQDYLFCSDKEMGNLKNLYIVADGMGGHKAGDYASRECVNSIKSFIEDNTEYVTPISILEAAIRYANDRLIKESDSNTDLEGMGTTLVAATVVDNVMFVANVGDSRLYIINDDIRQITEDHSLVEEMIKKGELDRKEARFHPNKNIITRALGAHEELEIDFFEIELEDNDIVLMCTDGLTNMIDDDEISDVIINSKDNNYDSTVHKLVKRANDYGGKDNITVMLITK